MNILVVDDNDGDAHLLEEMFAQAKNPNRVHIVHSGKEALSFLRRCGTLGSPAPDLIILDIRMPGMSGIDVLREIRQDPRSSLVPIIMLSSSDDEGDVSRCYELHANCYLTKPMGLDALNRLVSSIDDFWLSSVRLPSAVAKRTTGSDYH